MNSLPNSIGDKRISKISSYLEADRLFQRLEKYNDGDKECFLVKAPLKGFSKLSSISIATITIDFSKRLMQCMIDNTHEVAYFKKYTLNENCEVTPEIQAAINEFKAEVQLYLK